MKEIKFSKKIVKKLIIGCVILLLIVFAFAKALTSKARRDENLQGQSESVILEKRTLVSNVSATGKVASVEQSDIVANINGMEFRNIAVEVGDYVNVGDLLCEFNMDDVKKDLEQSRNSLNNSMEKSQIDVTAAQRRFDETKRENEIQNSRNSEAVSEALENYNEQLQKVEELKEVYNDIKGESDRKKQEIDNKNREIDIKRQEIAVKENQLKKAEQDSNGTVSGNSNSDKEVAKLKTALENLNNQLDDLQTELLTLQTQKYQLDSQVTSKDTEISQAEAQEDSLLNSYENSIEYREDAIRSGSSSLLNQKDSLETTKLNAELAGISDKKQIENYEKQLEEGMILSPISGVVTKVNFEEGDYYNGSVIMIVEDDSSFIVESHIDEYDIGKIKLGQKVIMKTNATGEEELTGSIIHIAPRADEALSQGGDVSYLVKISLDTKHEMIRLDMTARLSIILEEKEDVWAVPYDALYEDEKGLFYIKVAKEEEKENKVNQTVVQKNISGGGEKDGIEEKEDIKIYVSKGVESDYYVEIISEELKEGMEILLPPVEDSLTDLRLRMMEQGAMGGF